MLINSLLQFDPILEYAGGTKLTAFGQETKNDGSNLSQATTGFDYSRVLEQQVVASCTRPLYL